jgi:hypothetical protein
VKDAKNMFTLSVRDEELPMNPEILLLRIPYFHNKYPDKVKRYCSCSNESSWSPKLCPIHGATTPYLYRKHMEEAKHGKA